MSAIGPGDWVERIRCAPGALTPTATKGEVPMIGKIYQVRDVADRRCPVTGRTWQGLRLVGIVLAVPGHPDAYAQVEAFRPIYRPSADFIESLKQPSPAREPEHA